MRHVVVVSDNGLTDEPTVGNVVVCTAVELDDFLFIRRENDARSPFETVFHVNVDRIEHDFDARIPRCADVRLYAVETRSRWNLAIHEQIGCVGAIKVHYARYAVAEQTEVQTGINLRRCFPFEIGVGNQIRYVTPRRRVVPSIACFEQTTAR